MELVTPKQDVRRLNFAQDHASNPFANPAPSPYTPFSTRRSGSIASNTPQLPTPLPRDNVVALESSEEAERYIGGDLTAVLRGVAIDTITAAQKMSEFTPPVESALAYVSQIIQALDVQLELSNALCQARTLRPYARKMIRNVNTHLRIQGNTWLLLQMAWQGPEIQSDDLCTRRLSPSALDATAVFDVPGYVKLQRIVEWLERTADDALDKAGGPRVKPLDDPAYRWEYTASRVARNECVSMDYPLRPNQALDEVEQKAEARLSREVFKLVRAGRVEEAEEICRLVGQPWRAAALAGGKRGSALSSTGEKGLARRTWRKAASSLAQAANSSVPPHERAVYAALSGVLEPLLAVADGYEDEAWARLSILLDETAERALASAEGIELRVQDDVILQSFWECRSTVSGSDGVNGDLMKGIRQIQAFLSLGPNISEGHLRSLFQALAQLSELGLRQRAEWVCQFSAQTCLFLKLSGLVNNESPSDFLSLFDSSLQSYVRLIIKTDLELEEQAMKQGNIVPARPLVCSTAAHFLGEISSERRIIESYSELLCASLRADLTHEKAEAERAGVSPREIDERRNLCLLKASHCFSAETLTNLVTTSVDLVWDANLLRSQSTEAPSSIASDQRNDDITEHDEHVVRAIEFLMFPAFPSYDEALRRATTAARRFFLAGKRGAARHLIRWFPTDVLEQVDADLHASALQEFDCWCVYFDAVSKHSDWNNYHSNGMPPSVAEHTRTIALAQPGEVSYEDQANAKVKLQDFLQRLEEFNRISAIHRNTALDSLKSALLLRGGWMRSLETSSEDEMMDIGEAEVLRREEIEEVRRFGIPQLTLLLHHVLHESEMYAEATELAVLVGSEEFKLFESFGASELKILLSRIADSAVRLADGSVRAGEVGRPYTGTFFEELCEPDRCEKRLAKHSDAGNPRLVAFE